MKQKYQLLQKLYFIHNFKLKCMVCDGISCIKDTPQFYYDFGNATRHLIQIEQDYVFSSREDLIEYYSKIKI